MLLSHRPNQLKLLVAMLASLGCYSAFADTAAPTTTTQTSGVTSAQLQTGTLTGTPAFGHHPRQKLLNFNLEKFSIDGMSLTAIASVQHIPVLVKAMLDGLSLSDVSYDHKTRTASMNFELEKINATGTQLGNNAPIFNTDIQNVKVKANTNYLDPTNGSLLQVNIDKIAITPPPQMPNSQSLSIDDLAINGQCAHQGNSDALCTLSFTADQMTSSDAGTIGPITLNMYLKGNRNSMNAYSQNRRIANHAAQGTTPNLIVRQAQARYGMQSAVADLAAQGFEAGISKLYIKTEDGAINASVKATVSAATPANSSGALNVSFQANIAQNVAYRLFMLSKLVMNNGANINGTAALQNWKTPLSPQAQAEAAQTLNQWVRQGFLSKDGNNYTVSISWSGGEQVILNGKTFQPHLSFGLEPVTTNTTKGNNTNQ